jgi:hypothetical protein
MDEVSSKYLVMHEPLNDKNYLLYCASHYDSARYASWEDFIEDLNRIKYIKKLVTRYVEHGELKERLILNHIIVLNNCFGPEACCKILYFKLKPQMRYIKPFLVFLNILPEILYNVSDEQIVDTNIIPLDEHIVGILRKV